METSAVPTCVPSIETVTVSPLTPVPAMAGSAVVVSVLPLAGLVMVGAAGAVAWDSVTSRPVPPSEARLKVPLPKVEVWKSRLAVCEPLTTCNSPVTEL